MSSSTFLLVAATAACLFWAFWRPATAAKLDLPLIEFDGSDNPDDLGLKERHLKETGKLLKRGYDKYLKHGQAFAIRNLAHNETDRPLVFLPMKHLDEIKNAPQDKLSLPDYTERASILNHIRGPRITEEVQNAARINLNRALNSLIGPLQCRCFNAARDIMPPCGTWTAVHIYPIILQIFAHMSARVMVGPDLCSGWPAISLEYLTTVLKAPSAVRQKYHPWFYWAAKYFNPEIEAVMVVRRKAAQYVQPVLAARQAEFKAHGEAADKHDDFIQWLMDEHRSNKGKEITADELVQNIFITMVASMHGTSTICYSVLLNLLAHPVTSSEVKEEIQRIKKQELAEESGVWTRHSLGNLRLLDSVMRETLRLNPFTEVTMQRTVLVPYTFRDGLIVPAGLNINFTALQHNLDQDIYGSNADKFEPKRWADRRQGYDTSKYQFASTSDDWLNWGGGPHACPGRFLADVAIKLTLIYLLTKYEITYSDGRSERPVDARRHLMITPDMSTPLMFKEV